MVNYSWTSTFSLQSLLTNNCEQIIKRWDASADATDRGEKYFQVLRTGLTEDMLRLVMCASAFTQFVNSVGNMSLTKSLPVLLQCYREDNACIDRLFDTFVSDAFDLLVPWNLKFRGARVLCNTTACAALFDTWRERMIKLQLHYKFVGEALYQNSRREDFNLQMERMQCVREKRDCPSITGERRALRLVTSSGDKPLSTALWLGKNLGSQVLPTLTRRWSGSIGLSVFVQGRTRQLEGFCLRKYRRKGKIVRQRVRCSVLYRVLVDRYEMQSTWQTMAAMMQKLVFFQRRVTKKGEENLRKDLENARSNLSLFH